MRPNRPAKDEALYHLAQALDVSYGLSDPVEIFQGWKSDDDFEVPSVTIVAGDPVNTPQREVYNKRVADVDNDNEDEIEVTFRRAKLEIPFTLTVYTAGDTPKADRGDIKLTIDEIFNPDAPDNESEPRNNLEVTFDDHFGARCRYILDAWSDSDSEGARGGFYRAEADVMAYTSKLTREIYEDTTWEVTDIDLNT